MGWVTCLTDYTTWRQTNGWTRGVEVCVCGGRVSCGHAGVVKMRRGRPFLAASRCSTVQDGLLARPFLVRLTPLLCCLLPLLTEQCVRICARTLFSLGVLGSRSPLRGTDLSEGDADMRLVCSDVVVDVEESARWEEGFVAAKDESSMHRTGRG
jgi:hypothetical protein